MDDTVLSEEMQRQRGVDVDLSRGALNSVNVDTEHEEIIKADPFTSVYKIVENLPELATQDPRATKDKVCLSVCLPSLSIDPSTFTYQNSLTSKIYTPTLYFHDNNPPSHPFSLSLFLIYRSGC